MMLRQQTAAVLALVATVLLVAANAHCVGNGRPLGDAQLAPIRYEQRLGAVVNPQLAFTDESGVPVRLGDYFGSKPVILVMGYYGCPMLCTFVQNGLVECLADLRATAGADYQVVYVSINPSETASLAASKKKSTLKRYGRAKSAPGWHFLTGAESSITALASTVGFHFAYDPASHEYAHPSGFVVLTPDGRISRYFFGVSFPARDVYSALEQSGERTIGQKIQELVLLCFHYRPITGRYGATILVIVRVLGAATAAVLGWLIFSMARREAGKPNVPAQKQPHAEVVG